MRQYRISNAARSDIVEILRHSHSQFGEPAKRRYQALLLTTFEDIASLPQRAGSHDREEIAAGLRSYHLNFSRLRARQTDTAVRKPWHIVFYLVASDGAIEIVRLLHDAMEAHMHLVE
jgi:toxin ParE1/3/4